MNRTLKICCVAMFTALSIVTNSLMSQLAPNVQLGFTITICFLSGIYLGAVPAFVVGFLGDLIGHLIRPFGNYNWFIAISTALFGTICALVYKLPIKNRLIKLLIATATAFVVCSCGLNTFGLWLQYKVGVEPGIFGLIQFLTTDIPVDKTFWVYLGGRLPTQSTNMVINAIIVAFVQQTKVLDRLFLRFNRDALTID